MDFFTLLNLILQNPLVLTVIFWLFVLFIVLGLLFSTLTFLHRKHKAEIAARLKIFRVMLPKEAAEKEGDLTRAKSLAEIQEDIAVMEGVFASIGGLKPEFGLHSILYGRHDIFSFEMVVERGLIYFYVATPRRYADFITQQLYAQYPLASVQEVPDYNIFSPQGTIKGGYIKLGRPSFFAIKTYKKLEADPLNSFTNILSKLKEDESAAIQIILRPASGNLAKRSVKIASKIQQGKKASQVLQGLTLWGQLLDFIKLGSGAKKPDEQYRLSPLEEEMVKSLEEKASKAGLEVNIRVIVGSDTSANGLAITGNIFNTFSQHNLYQYGNVFTKSVPKLKNTIRDFIFRSFNSKQVCVLNTEELASLFHFPLPQSEAPNIAWLLTRQAPPPPNLPSEGVVIGKSVFRGSERIARIKPADRLRHTYIIGRSGTGKSWLMKNMAIQDIKEGNGLCVIDPHGDFAEDVLTHIPKERAEDLIYFNPADLERPLGFNILEYDENYPEQKTFAINEFINILDKLYNLRDTGGPMFEQYIRNAMLLIMGHQESGSTIMEISKVLADENFRKFKLSKIKDQIVYDFWVKEAEKAGGEAALANMVPYITSKLNQFISNDTMRPIIGQQKSSFNFREAMDTRKILIVNLSKGKIGELNSFLLGLVIVGKILAAALSRADMDEAERAPFYLYIDEFQNYITDSIAIILSEARKYGLGLIVAHQYIGQLVKNNDTSIRDAVFGNAGTILVFRIGVDDGEFLQKEFSPIYNARDLINIEKFNAYVRLLIDNTASKPFNLLMMPPHIGNPELAEKIKQLARLKYGKDKRLVELDIKKRTRLV